MTSNNGTQGDGMHGQRLPITDRNAQTKRVRRGTIVTYVVVLVAASAVFAVMMLTSTSSSSPSAQSNTGSGGMPGMDHGSAGMPASSPSPTMASDMPGMDHSSPDVHGAGTEHGTTAEADPNRPLAPVLGTFGGASSAVMFSAVFLRRKDRARSQATQAARAARRAQK